MKILAIGAHPDDIEFGAGGLLIKEASAGSEIYVCVASLGEAGSNGTAEQRKKEAEAAAEFYNSKPIFLDFGGDCKIETSPRNAIALAEVIRKIKPNIVLAPSQNENQHPDHKAVSDLARNAGRLARYGGLAELKDLEPHKIDALFYYPSSAEWDKKPEIFVDVSSQWEKWEKAMRAHESQMPTRGYIRLVQSKAAAWGASIGVEYAVGLWINDPVRINYLSDLQLSSRNYI